MENKIFSDLQEYFDFLGLIKSANTPNQRKEITHNLLVLTSFIEEMEFLKVQYFLPSISGCADNKTMENFLIKNSMQLLKNRLSKRLQEDIILNITKLQNNITKSLLQKFKMCKKLNIGFILPVYETNEEEGLASPEVQIRQNKKKDICLDF